MKITLVINCSSSSSDTLFIKISFGKFEIKSWLDIESLFAPGGG